LFHYRKANGEPLSFRSQHARLVPLRVWFRWMTRQNHILHNPASEIELPRLGRALPKNIFSAAEVERIMMQPDIEEPIGLRDRALLEVLYSTGMRRLELVRLKLYDLSLDRGLILINQGKGHKDRYVPIGERAVQWLQKYIREGRPQLASEPDDMTVFLTAQGEPFSRDHLSFTVKERIDAAQLGKTGSCHLFRHTMATLMHENGADIRYIQQMLGHEDLNLRVPSSGLSVSLRSRDLHGPVVALPCAQGAAQHFLNFLPLPQGQGSLRPILGAARGAEGFPARERRSRSISERSSGWSGSTPTITFQWWFSQRATISSPLGIVCTRTTAGRLSDPNLAILDSPCEYLIQPIGWSQVSQSAWLGVSARCSGQPTGRPRV
jgi:site-specific recombinase XerD